MSAYLYQIARTARGAGKAEGSLAARSPIELLGGLLTREQKLFEAAAPEDFVVGCVTQVNGQGANIARTAWLNAGLKKDVPGLTISRFCCSGLDALGYGLGRILSGDRCVVAGGVESTSQVAMFSDNGSWFSDAKVSLATGFVPMGVAADLLAQRHGYSRAELDAWTLRSHALAGAYPIHQWVVPVSDSQGRVLLAHDELVRQGLTLEKLSALQPAFTEHAKPFAKVLAPWHTGDWQGVHSVANAPAPADGAAIALLGDKSLGQTLNQAPIARIVDVLSAAGEPVPMLEYGPKAVAKLLARNGLKVGDIDLFEFNESFAATTLHFRDQLNVPEEKLNVAGGALARGHALGATGVMLVADVLSQLQLRNARFAVVAICGGAGVATACLLERL